jgi:arylsulfatase A-like enzyme
MPIEIAASCRSRGMMGFTTPNIDRIAREGVCFTDYYGQQSCTAGRPVFIGGNLSKIEESPKRAQ